MIIFWLSCFYIAGFSLHILKRANLSSASPISQGKRIRDFLGRNWPAILIRVGACTGIFMVWIDPSGQLDRLLPHIGLTALVGLLPAPNRVSFFNLAVAGALGFNLDSLLDWGLASRFPALQKELPAISEGS